MGKQKVCIFENSNSAFIPHMFYSLPTLLCLYCYQNEKSVHRIHQCILLRDIFVEQFSLSFPSLVSVLPISFKLISSYGIPRSFNSSFELTIRTIVFCIDNSSFVSFERLFLLFQIRSLNET